MSKVRSYQNRLLSAATELATARLGGRLVVPLPMPIRPFDEAEAYNVQRLAHAALTDAGFGAIVGHKIGCTTPVMQAMLGIASPCAGGVFSAGTHVENAVLAHSAFRRPGVECEIAVMLADDLTVSGRLIGPEEVACRVSAVMAAIEIVDDRYDSYQNLGTPTLIADDFFSAGCVLGAPTTNWRETALHELSGSIRINGAIAGRGSSSAVMGHPFAAVAWLANNLAKRGRILRKGEFILTGSIVETKWVDRGDDVVVNVDSLGEARIRFV